MSQIALIRPIIVIVIYSVYFIFAYFVVETGLYANSGISVFLLLFGVLVPFAWSYSVQIYANTHSHKNNIAHRVAQILLLTLSLSVIAAITAILASNRTLTLLSDQAFLCISSLAISGLVLSVAGMNFLASFAIVKAETDNRIRSIQVIWTFILIFYLPFWIYFLNQRLKQLSSA